jgi:arylsulfatase A-like enzyme
MVKPGIASAGKFRGSKHTVYEGGLRVPTVLEWPGKIEPGRTSYMSGTVDFLPTLMALTKVDFKFDDRPMDGINIENAIFQNVKERPVPMAFGWMGLWAGKKNVAWTENQYKLIVLDTKNQIELYDLNNDPSESNNIASENKKRVNAMKKRLEAWLHSCQLSRDGKDYSY